MRRLGLSLIAAVGVLSAALALPLPASAQTEPEPPPELPMLLDLRPNPMASVHVRYTPGSLDRASHAQDRFSILVAHFSKWAKRKQGLTIYLLSRREWEGLGGELPYGVPARLPSGQVLLSAWGDPGTVALWRQLLGTALPEIEGHPMRGTPEEASSLLLVDLFAQVEGCRALLGRTGYRGADPWVTDLMAHTVSLASSLRSEPSQLAGIHNLYQSLRRYQDAPTPGGARQPDRNDRERELRAWLAGQADIYLAARQLIDRRGDRAAAALLKAARKNGGTLTAADLDRRFPEIASWIAARVGAS